MYKWFKWCISDLRSVRARVNTRGYPCAKSCNSSASQWLSGEQVRLCSGHPMVHFGTIVEGSLGGARWVLRALSLKVRVFECVCACECAQIYDFEVRPLRLTSDSLTVGVKTLRIAAVFSQTGLGLLWKKRLFVCWLLNVPATCECISGTDLHRQFYVLPHWDRSCRSNFPSHPVTVYWHRADQSQRWPYNARRLAVEEKKSWLGWKKSWYGN